MGKWDDRPALPVGGDPLQRGNHLLWGREVTPARHFVEEFAEDGSVGGCVTLVVWPDGRPRRLQVSWRESRTQARRRRPEALVAFEGAG